MDRVALKRQVFFLSRTAIFIYIKERFWSELLGFHLVTLTNPYWWSRDINNVYVEWNKVRQIPFEM
jgi:hypothetical protein